MNFDKWARDLADQLRQKEQTQEIKPEDLYTHKDMMRGEGIFSPDYNPKTVKVLWNGEEYASYTPSEDISRLQPDVPGECLYRRDDGEWVLIDGIRSGDVIEPLRPSLTKMDELVTKEFNTECVEYNKLQEEARTFLEELDKAPLFVLGHNCTSTETVGSISSIPDIDYNGVSPKNHVDSFNVGDIHRATHDNCGQFMIDCYNNGIICQIDSIDGAFVTLVRVE